MNAINKLCYTYPVHSLSTLIARTTAAITTPTFIRTFFIQRGILAMKRKDYAFPELKDEDLEENFVRGSGPGGQAVNKTSNCVVLKHKPTGIVVKCHETRSLLDNQKKARERLKEKIDYHLHGDQSFLSQQRNEAGVEKSEKKRKAKDRLARKRAFKEREGLD